MGSQCTIIAIQITTFYTKFLEIAVEAKDLRLPRALKLVVVSKAMYIVSVL